MPLSKSGVDIYAGFDEIFILLLFGKIKTIGMLRAHGVGSG